MKRNVILFALALNAWAFSAHSQTVRSIQSIGVDEITVMELGGNGDIWIGTAGAGIRHYNAGTQVWATFSTDSNPGLKSDTINAIVLGPIGGVPYAFFGTPSGLSYSRGDSVFPMTGLLPAETNVTALALTSGDSLIAFTAGAGAVAFDTAQVRIGKSPVPCTHMAAAQGTQGYSCTTGLTAGSIDSGACYSTDYANYTILYTPNLVDDSVTAVFLDHGCNARFIGTRHGFSVCPVGNNCQNYTTANGLPEDYVTSLGQDCKGNVWIGLRDSGVAIFNPQTHAITRMTTANGLTTNQVTAIAFLADSCTGTGYIGTSDGNVALVDTNRAVVQILSSVQNIADNPFSIRLFPQPAANEVNFLFENEVKNGQFCLSDINGRILGYYNLKNTHNFTLDISNLSAGLYVYKILINDQMVKAGKVDVLR